MIRLFFFVCCDCARPTISIFIFPQLYKFSYSIQMVWTRFCFGANNVDGDPQITYLLDMNVSMNDKRVVDREEEGESCHGMRYLSAKAVEKINVHHHNHIHRHHYSVFSNRFSLSILHIMR